MRESVLTKTVTISDKERELAEQRVHKIKARDVMRRKHAKRSANTASQKKAANSSIIPTLVAYSGHEAMSRSGKADGLPYPCR